MKNKCKLLLLIPMVTATVAISACGTPEEKYSPNRLNSSGTTDIFANQADTYEDSPIEKVDLAYSYQDLFDNYIYQADNIPLKGDKDPRILVIPVWFKDSDEFLNDDNKESVRNDIKNSFFGNIEDVGWRSVAGYYKQESFNKFNLTGTVSEWYECNKSYKDFASNDVATSQKNTSDLVKDAYNWFKSGNTDYRDFDSDKDGYIDAIALIYACPDYDSYSRVNNNRSPFSRGERKSLGTNMWAYSFWEQDSNNNKNEPIVNSYLWASYDFMYDKNYPKNGLYGYGDTNYCKIDTHTFIHETGHLLGLQDYYDYGTTYGAYGAYSAAGYFSMQDNNVGGHDPYSKIALGWNKPYVIDNSFEGDSITINIRPNQETGDVILITPEFNNSPFDEYLLIELYTPTGLNQFDSTYPYLGNAQYKGSAESGIRLWHVDARLTYPSGKSNGKYTFNSDNITVNPTQKTTYGKQHATSNTTTCSDTDGYCSDVPGFENYRLLQLIRRNKNNSSCGDYFTKKDLFVTGDSFSTRDYNRIFVEREFNLFAINPSKCYLNSGKDFNFNISFDSVSAELATVTITKI